MRRRRNRLQFLARIWWIGIRGPIQVGLAGVIAFMVMTGRTEGSRAAEACLAAASELAADPASELAPCEESNGTAAAGTEAGEAPPDASEGESEGEPGGSDGDVDVAPAPEEGAEADPAGEPGDHAPGGGGPEPDGAQLATEPGDAGQAGSDAAPAGEGAAPAELEQPAAPTTPAERAPGEGAAPTSDSTQVAAGADAAPAPDASVNGETDGANASSGESAPAVPAEATPVAAQLAEPEPLAVGDAPVEGSHADAIAAARPASDHEHRDGAGTPPLDGDAAALVPSIVLGYSVDNDLPPAAREAVVTPSLAASLEHEAAAAGADWALVLATLRAGDELGREEITPEYLRSLSLVLAGLGEGSTPAEIAERLDEPRSLAERAAALARFHRAVGLDSLVDGLESARPRLERRVLASERIGFTELGRLDVAAGRIDVRVLSALLYLAEAHDGIVVSSLVSGHRLYARPGVLSAHVFGKAVDIAMVGGIPIVNGNARGAVTETAVRELLALPEEAWPKQLISLYDLGGPSFALANHADHIHLGY